MLPAHKQTLESLLADTVKQVAEATQGGAEAFAPPTITLERPKVAAHGDIACNVAMQLAKPLRAIRASSRSRSSMQCSPFRRLAASWKPPKSPAPASLTCGSHRPPSRR